MAEALPKKKKVRGGHRSSAVRIMGEAKEAMRSSRESAGTVEPPNLAKLT